jgi:hypothetical protein
VPPGQIPGSPPPANSVWPNNPTTAASPPTATGPGPALNGPSHPPASGQSQSHGGISPNEVAKELSELRQQLGTVQSRMSHLETRLREGPEAVSNGGSVTSPPTATPTPAVTPGAAPTPALTPIPTATPTPAVLEP